uniref:Gamma-secretase-activating protein C-terminal domain-containing protein n=1 Tax=Salarias fasciatus TaxID=181472 RepID=A0A672JPS7_SALFA
MSRILESVQSLCLPLPPGYHTMLAVFAVRCLPRHAFLQYVDHGFLQLTETFVSRLMTDLDNSDANERLKFSILKRLPQVLCVCFCVWGDRRTCARNAVASSISEAGGLIFSGMALHKLPILENVDARFVEETALKQTLILLGFEEK